MDTIDIPEEHIAKAATDKERIDFGTATWHLVGYGYDGRVAQRMGLPRLMRNALDCIEKYTGDGKGIFRVKRGQEVEADRAYADLRAFLMA